MIIASDYSEVRLPISTRFLGDVTLPEIDGDPPLEVTLHDGLGERSDAAWKAHILRTEGALDASTLELFAVARVEDPFGLKVERPVPLRVGQPVTSHIPGRLLEEVFVIPRDAVTGLNRIRLVDQETLVLGTAMIEQLWADDSQVVFRDASIEEGALLVRTRLVYAPDGGEVEIVDDDGLEEGASDPAEEAVPATGNRDCLVRQERHRRQPLDGSDLVRGSLRGLLQDHAGDGA